MKSASPRLCLAVVFLLAAHVPQAGAQLIDLTFFEGILNILFQFLGTLGIWDIFAQSLCQSFESLLPDTLNNCKCTGSFTANNGLGGEFFCALGGQNTCLIQGDKKDDPDLFCGIATVDTKFDANGFDTLEVCFEVASGLPSNMAVGNIPLYLCIEAIPRTDPLSFLEFSECGIKFNDRKCSRCTVCEGNRDFSFDCSNVNINPTNLGGFIAGPVTNVCFGFGGLLGLLNVGV